MATRARADGVPVGPRGPHHISTVYDIARTRGGRPPARGISARARGCGSATHDSRRGRSPRRRCTLKMRSALGRSLDAVIFAAYVAVVDGDPPAWPGPCPCANPRWCKPLSPQPAPRPEVVAYHGSRSNTNSTGRGALPAWSATGVPPANSGNWSSFDWSKVTTIGLFAPLEGPDGWDLLCTAHQHNVRVLPWAAAAFGRPSVSQV